MADVNKDRFNERLRGIGEKTQPGKRVEQRVTADGLVVDVVKTKKSSLIPYKSILTAIFVFLMMKGFIFAQLGEGEYMARIEGLQKGQAVEVAAAFLLDADPATRMIGKFLTDTLY